MKSLSLLARHDFRQRAPIEARALRPGLVVALALACLALDLSWSLSHASADSSGSCSYPSFAPIPSSDCTFNSAVSVAAGGAIVLTVVATTPPPPAITAASANQDCTGASVPPLSLSSQVFKLTCLPGLPAGTPISLTLDPHQHYPFTVTLAVAYNADGPNPTVDTVMLTSSAPPPPTVLYSAGWNLVGGPAGTVVSGASGSLFTYQAGDTSYEALPGDTPLQAGVGYWAFFANATSVSLPSVPPQDLTLELPAGQWVMLGNPFDLPMALTPNGGTSLLVEGYDPGSGNYHPLAQRPCCQINVGQGVWAFSSTGGSVTASLGTGPP